jgi:2-C-methyl-D-erythritol 2,4-cyclodiphosphate synthase
MRIGHGYDVHRLVRGRRLILGGLEIDFEYGLSGHSDADVLTHAVIDALLGAAGLGDIGLNFPDSDGAYKDISSLELLSETARMLAGKGFGIVNIDATIVAQRPRLCGLLSPMKENLCRVLEICGDRVNIKATTEEGLGFTGEGLGIAVHAVCLIEKT